MRSVIHAANRIVVKVGSSLVTNGGKGLDMKALNRWAAEITELKRRGKEVVLVSSGAIAEGCKRLSWTIRPKGIHELQAAAAVGQMGLCQGYQTAFYNFGLQAAQILLTHEDLANRTRYLNARSTLTSLLRLNTVPVINENDTVVTDEIRFGDNDTLGALVTNLVEADALIILTDQEGLYSADPRQYPDAVLIQKAIAGEPRLEGMAGGAGSRVGTGGMITKILAAKRAARSGAATVIACGREHQVLSRLADGENIGTQLLPATSRIAARKQWLADHLKLSGRLVLDPGAVLAVRSRGTSLLPIGVCGVEGDFLRGEAVACVDHEGTEVARGLVNYSSSEARTIMHKSTRELEAALGYMIEAELIHRDNMIAL